MFGLDPTIITFVIYIVGMLGIGIAAYYYTQNFSDYILGGRRLGSFVTAMSAGASDMSGWLLMGLPGAVYLSGLVEGWIAIGLTLGAYLNWLFIAGRLRVYTEFNNNALTLPEYFHHRFGTSHNLLKIVSATIILVFFTIYCASGVVASAKLFRNLFLIDYSTALWYGALATIIYTFIGGFLAVSWTDTIQATLMIFALLLTPVFVVISIGGIDELQNVLQQAEISAQKDFTDLFRGTSTVGLLSLAAWGLGYFGQPHILARFMAADSVRSLNKARKISMIWMVLCLVGAVAIGFFGMAYFYANANTASAALVNHEPEQVFIELSRLLFNPWIAGILLSAILAAVMSTLSCQLLISSSAITEDFYKGFIRPKASEKELVWLGRAMVLMIAAIAIWIAQDQNSKVLKLVEFAWAGFGSAFGPVVLLSLFWKRMTSSGAMAGMLTGAITVFAWKEWIPAKSELAQVYEMIPGFLLATLVIIVISLLSSKPDAETQETFEKAQEAYKNAL
ncbi:sodium/proline symporter PutP [Aggregatibacter aphrophilus]|uniref:Sodium/proline symporter n=2 Tax=Aggregatibacter aphrophilus TaxID=732 RepID=A0A336NHU5_AGGAP|nr:sodium/proline symporter PutP [Aggregatibacter aphrophilus]KNE86408.1 proline:sodium symporter PutP [Aggregatibacter aphrophilus ATCC 33389]OBY54831.1 sodium/proline symporter [Aggregatibacter aphrophilus]RDE84141.1 sodium/proline symporter PutP [Aggregatibacter aphrophilus]SSZ30463.1 Propionate transporter [Aggregatibacter aphrophilus]VEF42013.1 Propionate transporter [Aggregatibacter aphrophilus ATCC 33389]